MSSISASALRDELASGNPPVLVHVLPEEVFHAKRIARSINSCVYETAFASRMRDLVPDLSKAIVVYGEGAPSLDSAAAREKLLAAGYTNVTDFRGGLREWGSAGFPVNTNAPLPSMPAPNGRYHINPETSVVRWTGRNLFNHHHGTVKLSEGELVIENGVMKSAGFTLDMNSIACEDLTDPDWNAMLIRHLRDDDFFAVVRFPTAEFRASRAEPIADATPGMPNYLLQGELTLRGVTRPLIITAVIAASDEDHLTGQAQFEIDRTEFGSLYGSGKWFAFLGKHVVNDQMHLHVKVHAERVA